MPGIHVEATNMGTNVKNETTTDERGIYRFTELQAGPYKVTVTRQILQNVYRNRRPGAGRTKYGAWTCNCRLHPPPNQS